MLKKFRKVLLIVFGAALGLAVVGLIGLRIGSRDLPSAQDEDMKLKRADIPPAENAFAHVQEAAQDLHWGEDQDKLLKRVIAGESTDPAAATALLRLNRDALSALDRALGMPRFQVPEERPSDEASYSVLAWRRLAQLLYLRGRSYRESGNIVAALEDALKLLRLGHMVEGAQGSTLTYLIGNSFKSMGLDLIRQLLGRKGLSSRKLKPLIAQTEALRPEAKSFRETMQFEYTYMAAVIESPGQFEAQFRNGSRGWEWIKQDSVLSRYVYQKNATKKLYAERLREIAQLYDKNCSQVQLVDPDPTIEKRKLLATLWKPNIVGRILVSIAMPSRNLLVSKCRLQTEISATQALVALRAFRADRSEWPASLETLVPEYFLSIPLDDFDGRPLHYSPESKMVYSVGENLIDDKGSREKDAVFPIGF